MPIYKGFISEKKSREHATGQIRETLGVTDDTTLAHAFGLKGTCGTYSNGKYKMIELLTDRDSGTVGVDMEDLARIDDLEFIKKYYRYVIDPPALARYMTTTHRAEIASKTTDISKTLKIENMNDNQLGVICDYFFGQISKEEAKNYLEEYTNEEQAFADIIGRNIFHKGKAENFTVHGIEYQGYWYVSHYEFGKNAIKLTFDAPTNTIDGRKDSNGSRKTNPLVMQFVYFKNFVQKEMPLKLTLEYVHKFNVTKFTAINANRVVEPLKNKIDDDLREIYREIRTLLEGISPEDVGVDELADFLPSTVWARALDDLELAKSEFVMRRTEVKEETLREYADGNMNPQEFMVANKEYFLKQFKNILTKRFESNEASQDAYAERAYDETRDDMPTVSRNAYMSRAVAIAGKVMDDYASEFDQETDVQKLYEAYRSKNHDHDRRILDAIEETMLKEVSNIKADENTELKPLVRDELHDRITEMAEAEWDEWLVDHEYAKELRLDEKFVEETFDNYFADFYSRVRGTTSRNYEDKIDVYVRSAVSKKPTEYFAKNTPEPQDNATVPLETFKSVLKERFVALFEEFFFRQGVAPEDLPTFGINTDALAEEKLEADGIEQYYQHFLSEYDGEDLTAFLDDCIAITDYVPHLTDVFNQKFNEDVELVADQMSEDADLQAHVGEWRNLAPTDIPNALKVIVGKLSVENFLEMHGIEI